MTVTVAQNINKYQRVAGNNVVSAVASAAKKTGVDFSFLMQKAATESSFNPAAKAKTSSATGLYQFIDQTWLTMVKKYGDKHGLSAQAGKIDMKDGKAVVADTATRQQILDLRKDPKLSALMAGEFTAENKNYLECSTNCDVGATELYLAHFMGAGGAAKFLNSRENNGNASAAQLFPQAAKANRAVFFDRASGKPRTLNQIYDHFAQKFSGGTTSPLMASGASPHAAAAGSVSASATAARIPSSPSGAAAQTYDTAPARMAKLSYDDIVWDTPRYSGALGSDKNPLQKLSPVTIMVMTQMQETLTGVKESQRYNA